MTENKYEFIDLNRSFHELSQYARENDDVDLKQVFHVGERLRWPDLTREYRVVMLSEAGSGKTVEIRNIACKLKNEGKAAFFIRLEHIPGDFEDAFEVGSFDEFQTWLASEDEGWLFLDSVDEARLRNPGDFELAVRKLGRRISLAKDRTHIVVTGRTSAWRPKTDLSHCEQHLPFAASDRRERKNGQSEDSKASVATTDRDEANHRTFKLVALDDLTSEQIEQFAKAKGVTDTTALLHAVERADAWSFTSRPQDLEELTEFWIDQGRIGSRLELMQNSIRRRLRERDQTRAEAQPLSDDDARFGARLLAAATTLAQEPVIYVPDGADNSKGVSVREVLPDWDDKKLAALLSRPIFDEAIYGTVRFHHRSVREYLAAEWLSELLKRETSRRKIETLLFKNQYGLDVIVPTMRPVMPWLAILDGKIRERLRVVAPEVVFEGGDPSQLPLEIRRTILLDVCEQLDNGTSSRSVTDRDALLRFANVDMTADIRSLLAKYSANDELTGFFLRMIWLGELADLLPEAKAAALTVKSSTYTRIAAFRAVNAIGSEQDCAEIRNAFLGEADELKREWLGELVQDAKPSNDNVTWLLAALKKCERKPQHSVDRLVAPVEAFVQQADVSLLPELVQGMDKLLEEEPVIERRFCEVSEKFDWLLKPAARAADRLIAERSPAALEPAVLGVLHRFPTARDHYVDELRDSKFEFEAQVPQWADLNRALFWYEIERARERRDRMRGERLDEFWQANIYRSFWQFGAADFDYALEQIAQQTGDNRLVALSLAFQLYVDGGRKSAFRKRLKEAVAGDGDLEARLTKYLRPPRQSKEARKYRQQDAAWKKRSEERKRKEKEHHEGWKKYLSEHVEELRNPNLPKPHQASNAQYYLNERMRELDGEHNRWTDGNWKCLIGEYGEEVAHAFRDGVVAYWRRYKPKLRSEGAPFNQTPFSVILGLTGLHIEATEVANWSDNLSEKDVDLACRYASHELNGFPTWFPKLFERYPQRVGDFLFREIRFEFSVEESDTDTHYILSDVSWSGEWSWDRLAPQSVEFLRAKEPANLNNLCKLLSIIQGSSISDEDIRNLAAEKCRKLRRRDHLAAWYAVWAGVDPDAAIAAFSKRVEKIKTPDDQVDFAMKFATHLMGGRRGEKVKVRHAYRTPQHLKALYLLMHKYIRRKEDIERAGTGVYSPGLRDHAQEARDGLFSLLNDMSGKEAFLALTEISELHPEETSRPWMIHLAKSKAEKDADVGPWLPVQVREFHNALERTPTNHRELTELATLHLLDLKDDLENGDSSIAQTLLKVTQETEMRNFIGHELRQKAAGRYSIPQEEELADAKRPDLRFHGVGFDGPVPGELKLADKWSGPDLFERLENQLCGDYLRDNRSNHGLFVLVYMGEKGRWDIPTSANRVDFEGLVAALQSYWEQIAPKFPGVDDITVVGIDLTKRKED